jgi:hypothetical protein
LDLEEISIPPALHQRCLQTSGKHFLEVFSHR